MSNSSDSSSARQRAIELFGLYQKHPDRWADAEAFLADPAHAEVRTHLQELLAQRQLTDDLPPTIDSDGSEPIGDALGSSQTAETADVVRSETAETAVLAGAVGAFSAATDVPEQIGPYRLLEPLGEGGFGVVYRAEQRGKINRTVAIKIIKKGMDTKQVLARFDAEKNALSLMNHPNIARVIDSGETDAGQPYFVMEYVEGTPITEYCQRERLSLEERLRLFQQVCRGVQHAQSKAVVHRDLKPANIIVTRVDGKAVPKIIDFGLVKALGGALTEMTVVTQQRQNPWDARVHEPRASTQWWQ